MNIHRSIGSAGIAVFLAGCATGNGEHPLMFGSSNVVGLSMGGNVTETGGEFVFGYKGNNFAIVPVSAVNQGTEEFIGSGLSDGSFRDTFSVIGQFAAEGGKLPKGANAGLGKFFATGFAAQNLAIGFSKKMGAYRTQVPECQLSDPQPPAPKDLKLTRASPMPKPGNLNASLHLAKLTASANGSQASNGAGAPHPAASVSPARLIFAQQDIRALAIDGSGLEAGVKFTLGYRDRNLALIPVVGRDASGKLVSLSGTNPDSGSDVLSVLGQFQGRDTVNESGISSGLHAFFTTGAAASYLSDGFKVKLCEEYVATVGTQLEGVAKPSDQKPVAHKP
jgi:hypothetical protein